MLVWVEAVKSSIKLIAIKIILVTSCFKNGAYTVSAWYNELIRMLFPKNKVDCRCIVILMTLMTFTDKIKDLKEIKMWCFFNILWLSNVIIIKNLYINYKCCCKVKIQSCFRANGDCTVNYTIALYFNTTDTNRQPTQCIGEWNLFHHCCFYRVCPSEHFTSQRSRCFSVYLFVFCFIHQFTLILPCILGIFMKIKFGNNSRKSFLDRS